MRYEIWKAESHEGFSVVEILDLKGLSVQDGLVLYSSYPCIMRQ